MTLPNLISASSRTYSCLQVVTRWPWEYLNNH